jgi:hypothetical protein
MVFIYLTFMAYVHRSGKRLPSRRAFHNRIASRRSEIADFERELGIKFTEFKNNL